MSWGIFGAVALVFGITAVVQRVVEGSFKRRKQCPACESWRATLQFQLVEDDGGEAWACLACGAVFKRLPDGPLIADAHWKEGARDAIPTAIAKKPK